MGDKRGQLNFSFCCRMKFSITRAPDHRLRDMHKLLLHGFVVDMRWSAVASFRQPLFHRASWPRVDVDSALLPGRA